MDPLTFVNGAEGTWTKPSLGKGRQSLKNGTVVYRYCAPSGQPAGPTVRAVSYNLYLGGRWRMERDQISYLQSLQKIVQNVSAASSGRLDVLALQEVDIGGRRVEGRDPVDWIAHHFGLCGVFGEAQDFSRWGGVVGHFGNAILTRVPVDQIKVQRFRQSNREGLLDSLSFEHRGMAGIRIGDSYFFSTHLSPGWAEERQREDRRLQIAQILATVRELGSHRVMVMGDFNFNPDSLEGEALRREFHTANELTAQPFVGSFAGHDDPGKAPTSQLDHFYVRGFGDAREFKAHRPSKPKEQGSDHLAMFFEIEL